MYAKAWQGLKGTRPVYTDRDLDAEKLSHWPQAMSENASNALHHQHSPSTTVVASVACLVLIQHVSPS